MKKLSTKHISTMAATAVALLLPLSGFGQTVIGSWQDTDGDGWIDWGTQGALSTLPAKYSYANVPVSGYAQSLKITQAGWNQNLALKLQNNGYVDDFENNHLLSFTFSVPAASETGSTSGYSQMASFYINSPAGFSSVAWNSGLWSYSGSTSGNQSGMPNFYYYDGAPARSQTVTLDYSSLLPAIGANPGWLEIIFATNNGGGAPDYCYMNNVVLYGGPVPEPSAFALMGLGVASLLALRRRRSA